MLGEIKVLDKGFVRLVEVMGNDISVVQGARVSYGAGAKDPERDKTLLRYLFVHKHSSPFEMVEFKFHIRCPIFVARQWVRHRMWSYNEYSMRYSPAIEDFYVPETWRKQDKVNIQGSAGTLSDEENKAFTERYRRHCEESFKIYNEMIAAGVAREMARGVIPISTYTEFYGKTDLNNFIKFLNLREDSHAQYEIQVYARAMKELVRSYVPWTIEIYEETKAKSGV